MRAICWVRNDLRVDDHAALAAFAARAREGWVVWSPGASLARAGTWRRDFTLACVREFGRRVESLGGAFVALAEPAAEGSLPQLVTTLGVDTVFHGREVAPEEHADEASIAALPGLRIEAFDQASLLDPARLPFAVPQTPEVFSQFRRRVEGRIEHPAPLPAPAHLPAAPGDARIAAALEATPVLDLDGTLAEARFHPRIPPGEAAGLARLEDYVWRLDRPRTYRETRDGLLEWDDSTKLSPWLALGALSARRVQAEVARYERERVKNDSTYWIGFELLWRDYFRLVAAKHGARLFARGGPRGAAREEPSDAEARFERWRGGETGDAFIDANLRELNATGWMSNRGRQNVASHLAKTLGVDWRRGAAWFERQLIDYDVASNWGNWAYVAGTGQDPRDRVFDPARQAETYDPQGLYRARWARS